MRESAEADLEAGLRTLGIPRVAAVRRKLIEYGNLLLEENKRTNLTGAKNIGQLIWEHFLDSLAPLDFVELAQPVIDVGSGAGLPGIPTAIAFPKKKITLLEPRAKRAAFLSRVAKKLELENVSVIKASARGPGAASLAASAGTVLMRAVAEPQISLALGLPLLRCGGQILLYEGRSARPTPEQRRTASAAGGGEIVIKRVSVPGLSATRHAWVVRKVADKSPKKDSLESRVGGSS